MAPGDELAGVSSAEWLAWLQPMDQKLDRFLDKLNRPALTRPESDGVLQRRIGDLEERVAKIERKLDISSTFEPN
jgi:hypothetical protein